MRSEVKEIGAIRKLNLTQFRLEMRLTNINNVRKFLV